MRRHWYLLLPLVAVIIAAGLATLLPRRHTTTEQHNEQQTTPPLTVSPAPSPPGAAKKPAAPSDGAATLAPAPREGTDARPVAPVPETEDQKPPRLLWEIKAGGGPDFFTEILPAGDMLVGIRNGALYCLEARTGKIIWKYPDNGEGWRTCAAGCIPVPQLIGIVGDEVIAPLPEGQLADRAAGCTGFRLSDGAMMHRHTVGTGYTHEVVPNSGSRVAFAQYERRPPAAPPLRDQPVVAESRPATVTVVDLQRWREAASFTLPLPASKLRVRGDRVFGLMWDEAQKTSWAFTVNMKKGELFRVPVQGHPVDYALLEDGRRIFGEGVVSAECAYERPWPWGGSLWPGTLRAEGPAVYTRETLSFCRVDPATGRALWACPLGLGQVCVIATSAELAASLEDGVLHIFSAKDGAPRAVIPMERFDPVTREWRYTCVACDRKRVYVATRGGLWAFSAHALNPETPDLSDPSDPASALSACREALMQGDYEKALKSLRGIARMVAARPGMPAQRMEAAEVLSQLSRSPATSQFPALWQNVMLQEGWAAGGLFLDEYMRLAPTNENAVAALLLLGTKPALTAAAGLLDRPRAEPVRWGRQGLLLALDASERLTGRRPYDRALATGDHSIYDLVRGRPIEPEVFKGLVAGLWKLDRSWHRSMLERVPPEQVVLFLESKPSPDAAGAHPGNQNQPDPGPLLQTARQQLLSRDKGTGQREPIQVLQQPQTPPHGEF